MKKSKAGSEYPDNWTRISRAVKESAGWCCLRCGHPHDPANNFVLTVHHLDLDKGNNAWWNLAALCQACHLSIQSTLNLNQLTFMDFEDWIKPYLAGYYAHLTGRPEDRPWVVDHLAELLENGRVAL